MSSRMYTWNGNDWPPQMMLLLAPGETWEGALVVFHCTDAGSLVSVVVGVLKQGSSFSPSTSITKPLS